MDSNKRISRILKFRQLYFFWTFVTIFLYTVPFIVMPDILLRVAEIAFDSLLEEIFAIYIDQISNMTAVQTEYLIATHLYREFSMITFIIMAISGVLLNWMGSGLFMVRRWPDVKIWPACVMLILVLVLAYIIPMNKMVSLRGGWVTLGSPVGIVQFSILQMFGVFLFNLIYIVTSQRPLHQK